MSSDSIKFKGIILSSEDYKEKDKMITFLSSEYGIIRVCAKGASKAGSKSSFLSVPFMLCEVVASLSHGFYYFKDGVIISNNSGIHSSLDAITAASHMAEVLLMSVHQTENSKESYELAVYAFYSLGINPDRYKDICSAFNWRLLSLLGLSVTYHKCSRCHKDLLGHIFYLSITDGTVFCDECIPRNTSDYYRFSQAGINVLNYYATEAINKIFTTKCSDSLTDKLLDYTLKYISLQFDHNFNSFDRLRSSLLNNPVRREET